jgi:hypothetical protein
MDLAIVFQVILPFIIQLTCSILLGYYIIKLKRKLYKEYNKEVKICVTIISIDLFNLVTCMPYFIFGFIQFYFPDYQTIGLLIAMDALQSIYYSTQFFVYLICNNIFRAQFSSSFLCLTKAVLK